MGLFSSKKNTTNVEETQNNFLTESGALGIYGSSNVTVERADIDLIGQTVDNAFMFGAGTVVEAFNFGNNALEANLEVSGMAFDAVNNAVDNSFHFAGESATAAYEFSSESRESSYIFAGEAVSAANQHVANESEYNRQFLGEAFGASTSAIFQAAGFAAQTAVDSTMTAAGAALQSQINTTNRVIDDATIARQDALILQGETVTQNNIRSAQLDAQVNSNVNALINASTNVSQQGYNALDRIAEMDSANFSKLNDTIGDVLLSSEKMQIANLEAQREAAALASANAQKSAQMAANAANAATRNVSDFSLKALQQNTEANSDARRDMLHAYDMSNSFVGGAFNAAIDGISSQHEFVSKSVDAVIDASKTSTERLSGEVFDMVKMLGFAVAAAYALPYLFGKK